MIHRLELSVTAKKQQRFRSSCREDRGSRREGRNPRTHFNCETVVRKTKSHPGRPVHFKNPGDRTGSLSLCEDASPTHERYCRARYPRTTHTENRDTRRGLTSSPPDGKPPSKPFWGVSRTSTHPEEKTGDSALRFRPGGSPPACTPPRGSWGKKRDFLIRSIPTVTILPKKFC